MHCIIVDDKNQMFVLRLVVIAIRCRLMQSQHAQLFLAALLCLNHVHCPLTSYSKSHVGYFTISHQFHIGLLTWQTCFASFDCFELLHQEPVKTAASCMLWAVLCSLATLYQA